MAQVLLCAKKMENMINRHLHVVVRKIDTFTQDTHTVQLATAQAEMNSPLGFGLVSLSGPQSVTIYVTD